MFLNLVYLSLKQVFYLMIKLFGFLIVVSWYSSWPATFAKDVGKETDEKVEDLDEWNDGGSKGEAEDATNFGCKNNICVNMLYMYGCKKQRIWEGVKRLAAYLHFSS